MGLASGIRALWRGILRSSAEQSDQTPGQGAWRALATHGVGVGIWEWDVVRQVLVWDDTVYELFGVSRDAGKTPSEHWRSAVFPEDIRRVLAEENALCRYGREVCQSYRIRLPDGSVRYIGSRASVERDEHLRPIKMIGICEDITDRVLASEQMERERRLAEQTSRMAKVGGWSLNLTTCALYWSEEVYRIHEVPLGETVDLDRAIRFYVDEAQATIREAVERGMSTGQPWNLELPLITAKGNLRWVRTLGEASYVEGRCVLLSGAIQDITEEHRSRVELEQSRWIAESASRAKSEFLANMSHELRTPLTAILGFADVAMAQLEHPDSIESSLSTIRSNGEHLLAVINDLLDLSKIEAGKMTLEHEPTPIRRIVQDVAGQHRMKAERKGLEVRLELDGQVPAMVLSDPTRVRQMLHNLVGNAVKFTDRGHVAIECSFIAERDAEHRGELRIAVVDTGVGMSRKQLERVFEPFVQADASTTRRFGGSGLGLSVTQRLTRILGGSLGAESTPGVGSRFTIVIPVDVVQQQASMPDPVDRGLQQHAAARLDGLRILLVDDSPDIQRLLMHMLQKAGADVTLAIDGQEAVDRVLSDPDAFDLILMDMQMPLLDGYETTRLLRGRGIRTPVLAVTAHAMAGDRERCLVAGCDGYTTKPVNRGELISLCIELTSRERKMAG